MSSPIRNFVKYGETPLPWEEFSGPNALNRTRTTGRIGIDFREDILKIPISEGPALREHTEFIHKLGSHALQVQVRVDKLKEADGRSPKKSDRIIPKRVRVEDVAEDSDDDPKTFVLSIDDDWGAISWNDEMVTSGCETLYAKFQDPIFLLDEQRRTKAVAMLEKLVNNHSVGEVFVKQNIEYMMKSSTSRLDSCPLSPLNTRQSFKSAHVLMSWPPRSLMRHSTSRMVR